jgi:hypothetical protein
MLMDMMTTPLIQRSRMLCHCLNNCEIMHQPCLLLLCGLRQAMAEEQQKGPASFEREAGLQICLQGIETRKTAPILR